MGKNITDVPYFIAAKWGNSGNWYKPLELKILNRTDESISGPTISFDISKIQNVSPWTEIVAYNNFDAETKKGPVIKGKLVDWEHKGLEIPAQGHVKLTFGVNFSPEANNPGLPENFTFNNEPIVLPEDHEAPTTPGGDTGLQFVSAGPHTIALQWEPSTDNFMVKQYNIHVNDSVTPIITESPTVTLHGLSPNTEYAITKVTATDYSANESKPAATKSFSTSDLLPALPKWTSGFHIKASPFVDATANPTPNIAEYSTATGLKAYTLGFITGDLSSGSVKAAWGGFSKMSDSNTKIDHSSDATVSDYYKNYIEEIRAKGGDVILSFGGASNHPIEADETSIAKLIDNYLKVIDNYQLKAIDFDFEGGFVDNVEALDRHISAIIKVIQTRPELKISYTLPVDGGFNLMGFSDAGERLVKQIHDAGITPSLFNAMSMEFGTTTDPLDPSTKPVYTNYFEAVKNSIEGIDDGNHAHRGMIKQLMEVYTNLSREEVIKMIGICPMFGDHNATKLSGIKFTPEDQKNLQEYFGAKGVPNLNGWDATRDMNQGEAVCRPTGSGEIYKCTNYGEEAGVFSKILAEYEPVLSGDIAIAPGG